MKCLVAALLFWSVSAAAFEIPNPLEVWMDEDTVIQCFPTETVFTFCQLAPGIFLPCLIRQKFNTIDCDGQEIFNHA